jgi:hypothetical protein
MSMGRGGGWRGRGSLDDPFPTWIITTLMRSTARKFGFVFTSSNGAGARAV